MESNFQVKITADLSELQKSISQVKTSLSGISDVDLNMKGLKTATTSINNFNSDTGRARMTAFAFGQVIRDAGFFSQNFGLGLLAVSNNIPILIDQLTLLTGVSAGMGAAISLLGSFLTAGLTAFAYYAQGVARDGETIGSVMQKMALDGETYLGRLVNYLSTPPASEILNNVIGGIESGATEIKNLFESIAELIIAVWNRFGTEITSVTDTIFSYFSETLKFQLGNALNIVKAFTSVLSGDFSGLADAVTNIFKGIVNQIINVLSTLVSVGTTYIGAFVGVFDKLKGEQIKIAGKAIMEFGESLKFTSTESKSANFNLRQWISGLDVSAKKSKEAADAGRSIADVYQDLDVKLKQINANVTDSFTEKSTNRVKAYQSAIDELIKMGVDPASESIRKLQAETVRFNADAGDLKNFMAAIKAAQDLDKQKQKTNTNPDRKLSSVEQDELNAAIEEGMPLWERYYNLATAAGDATTAKIELTKLKIEETGIAVANMVAGPLSQAFQTMMETGVFSFEAIGQAIADMVKKLIAAAMAALALALILAAFGIGTVGGNFNKIFKATSGLDIGGGGSGGGGLVENANGGIYSGPTAALVGEYPGAKSNPEVIAPLDKLQSIIAGSGGGQQMTGTLETRISGNDLVILMDRANKTRGNYFG